MTTEKSQPVRVPVECVNCIIDGTDHDCPHLFVYWDKDIAMFKCEAMTGDDKDKTTGVELFENCPYRDAPPAGN